MISKYNKYSVSGDTIRLTTTALRACPEPLRFIGGGIGTTDPLLCPEPSRLPRRFSGGTLHLPYRHSIGPSQKLFFRMATPINSTTPHMRRSRAWIFRPEAITNSIGQTVPGSIPMISARPIRRLNAPSSGRPRASSHPDMSCSLRCTGVSANVVSTLTADLSGRVVRSTRLRKVMPRYREILWADADSWGVRISKADIAIKSP